MSVHRVALKEGDIVLVEVHPASFPPVRYKGKVWIRRGPRRGIANEDDERRLYEKRVANITTFDAMPCIGATLQDLDASIFKQFYLYEAFPEEVIKDDKRTVKEQMEALGFFDTRFDCPTYSGILFFGKNVERHLPGAYVQYVRFEGNGRAGNIRNEYKFAGNLCKILNQLDTFVDTSITNRRPVPISALREETIVDYPHWAIRELLMNAICHRDYESNGPVQFYQYDNHLEIMNPGALYGKVNPRNFPNINDYRNPVVAEGMKVLGFVNRYSRGVMRVKEELQENGNPMPDFNLELETAFSVVVKISEVALKYYPDSIEEYATNNVSGGDTKGDTKSDTKGDTKSDTKGDTKGDTKSDTKSDTKGDTKSDTKGDTKSDTKGDTKSDTKSDTKGDTKLSILEVKVLQLLTRDPSATYQQIVEELGIGRTAVFKSIKQLKDLEYIERQNGRKFGSWNMLKNADEEEL